MILHLIIFILGRNIRSNPALVRHEGSEGDSGGEQGQGSAHLPDLGLWPCGRFVQSYPGDQWANFSVERMILCFSLVFFSFIFFAGVRERDIEWFWWLGWSASLGVVNGCVLRFVDRSSWLMWQCALCVSCTVCGTRICINIKNINIIIWTAI